ncbi:hypothetical protein [Gordonia sp. FQ]|uniref:hypothetical protein n=1 Tax=Gordonia sp. FQ TaxID=3446634 RepID=UPI003F871D47
MIEVPEIEFTADQIDELLGALEEELRRRGLAGIIFIVGGAAMALAYNASRSTGDIDGVLRPRDDLLAAADAVAAERGLPKHWLSDGVTQIHMPDRADPAPITRVIGPALTIEIASAEYVLAMKAMSTRHSDGDLRDAAELCRLLGISDEHQIEQTVRRFYGGDVSVFGAQELWFDRIAERVRDE